MNWNPFKRKPVPAIAPAIEEVVKPVQQELEFRLPVIRPSKWVSIQGQVGIVSSLDNSGYVIVDLVDAEGATAKTVRVHGGMVQLARLSQIPAPRRPADEAYAATLGYV